MERTSLHRDVPAVAEPGHPNLEATPDHVPAHEVDGAVCGATFIPRSTTSKARNRRLPSDPKPSS